jgi:hypothetical protein
MRMPGYAAEASLYKSGELFEIEGAQIARSDKMTVVPAGNSGVLDLRDTISNIQYGDTPPQITDIVPDRTQHVFCNCKSWGSACKFYLYDVNNHKLRCAGWYPVCVGGWTC